MAEHSMAAQCEFRQPLIRKPTMVSFSGIDGAGKSTQIEHLSAGLKQAGLHVQQITFWNDIAGLTRIREAAGHTLFQGDRGVGTPANPIQRRDKNVQSRFMTAVRLGLYLLDTMSLYIVVRKSARLDADVVIFDRYIYDELANLSLRSLPVRLFVRLVTTLAPKLDVSYLLDADPVRARARKPEYPIEFLYANRASYFALNEVIGRMTVIAPMPASIVRQEVWKNMAALLSPAAMSSVGTEALPDKTDTNNPARLEDLPAAP